MIEFNYETDFKLEDETKIRNWIDNIISFEGYELGEVIYIFSNDEYLHKLNVEFLDHDTFTDIISFDYGVGMQINGEIYISVERVAENAIDFKTDFKSELNRVIIHGILHFCGYKDKSIIEEELMRKKEDDALLRLLKT